jgi:hypothetical protein
MRRELNHGCHALLLLQERGGGEDPDASGVIPFLRGSSNGDHGVELLLELSGLGSLKVVVGSHRRWWRDTPRGGVAHRSCNGRREGGRP